MMRRLFLVSMLAVFLALVGCGGGGGADAPTQDLIVDFQYSEPSGLSRFIDVQMLPLSRMQTSGKSCAYTLVGGSLPPGLTLNGSSGAIQGAPTQPGGYNATIQLTVAGYRGAVQTSVYLGVGEPVLRFGEIGGYYIPIGQDEQIDGFLTFVPGQTPKTAVLSLGPANTGGYDTTHTMVSSSFSGPLTFRLVGDVPLPEGITLNSATGRITCAPTQPGISELKFEATATIGGNTYTFAGQEFFTSLAVFRRQGGTGPLSVEMPVWLQGGVTPALKSGAEGMGWFYCTYAFADGKVRITVDEAWVKDLPAGVYASRNRSLLGCGTNDLWLRGYLTVDASLTEKTR